MTRPEDTGSNTVEDAADYERWRADGDAPDDEVEAPEDGDGEAEEDEDDGPCCNCFDCPCGGTAKYGR